MLTGGGPPQEVKYSQIEAAVLAFLKPTAYAGLPIPESDDGHLSK